MRNSGFWWVIIGIMLLLDIYVFQAVKVVLPLQSPRIRLSLIVLYWLFSITALALMMLMPAIVNNDVWSKHSRTYVYAVIVGVFFAKVIISVFLLMDDIRRGCMWVIGKLFSNPSVDISQSSDGITRSVFLSWLGLAAGGSLFATLIYGFSNKYNYHVNRVKVAFDNLPAAFKGMKIVHISDIHAGSFTDRKAVEKGVQKILKEQPDLILFTGDLVNDRASEMAEYMEIFGKLRAPMGVYSTLGNHDYGDYVKWRSAAEKAQNLDRLKEVHGEIGWRLLMNEHVVLQKGDDKIALLGIENWSAKGTFPKYGRMDQAHEGTSGYPFKILMSHDPSHWDAEVRKSYPDIDLMLSGHTHGMQFGLDLPGFKWSPVQYIYKQWAGLYEQDKQKLYVNRGFGFIGYPGRVGILPEITVLELT